MIEKTVTIDIRILIDDHKPTVYVTALLTQIKRNQFTNYSSRVFARP